MSYFRPAVRVALGDRHYEVSHVSGGVETPLTSVSDVAVMGQHIVVLRRQAPDLRLLDSNGKDIGTAQPQLTCGHGIRRISPDMLAVTDMDGHKVLLLDRTLNEVARLDCHGRPRLGQPFNHPTDCARGPDGRLYVSDGYGNSHVHVFTPDLSHIFSFGEPGAGAGQFSTPHSIVFDAQGRLCVADRENNRVQRFDPEGRWLDQIEGLHKPMALALAADGTLLVTDQTPRLSAYDADGRLTGRCRSLATYAHGMDVMTDGTIVLAEMIPDRVTFLRPIED